METTLQVSIAFLKSCIISMHLLNRGRTRVVGLLHLCAYCLLIRGFAVHAYPQNGPPTEAPRMSSMPQISYGPLISGIELLPGTSPEFEMTLRSFADADSVSSIRPIIPYSIVVKNNTTRPLIGITVRFYLAGASGRTVWHQMTVGTRSNRASNLIAPGEAVLVTPETGLNAVLRPGLSLHTSDVPILKARLAKHAHLYSQQERLTISVDSVIFENGDVVGPDNARMLQMLNAWAAAEDAVTQQVLLRHGSEVDAYLISIRLAPLPQSKSLESIDHFAKRQHEFAGELLDHRKAFKSEEDCFSYLRDRLSSRIPALRRREK